MNILNDKKYNIENSAPQRSKHSRRINILKQTKCKGQVYGGKRKSSHLREGENRNPRRRAIEKGLQIGALTPVSRHVGPFQRNPFISSIDQTVNETRSFRRIRKPNPENMTLFLRSRTIPRTILHRCAANSRKVKDSNRTSADGGEEETAWNRDRRSRVGGDAAILLERRRQREEGEATAWFLKHKARRSLSSELNRTG